MKPIELIGHIDQGNRIAKSNLGKTGKGASEAAFSEVPRKHGVFETQPYNRLIVVANIIFGDLFMSLKKSLENRGNRGAIALGIDKVVRFSNLADWKSAIADLERQSGDESESKDDLPSRSRE